MQRPADVRLDGARLRGADGSPQLRGQRAEVEGDARRAPAAERPRPPGRSDPARVHGRQDDRRRAPRDRPGPRRGRDAHLRLRRDVRRGRPVAETRTASSRRAAGPVPGSRGRCAGSSRTAATSARTAPAADRPGAVRPRADDRPAAPPGRRRARAAARAPRSTSSAGSRPARDAARRALHPPVRERPHYICASARQATGLCDAPAIPADVPEAKTLDHLADFRLDVERWLATRVRRSRPSAGWWSGRPSPRGTRRRRSPGASRRRTASTRTRSTPGRGARRRRAPGRRAVRGAAGGGARAPRGGGGAGRRADRLAGRQRGARLRRRGSST
jgi:hypothetical protein